MLGKLRKLILKQHMIPIVGGIKAQLISVMAYGSMMSLLLIIITAYNTPTVQWVGRFIPHWSIWTFFGILAVCLLVLLIIDYKLITPSSYRYTSTQMAAHESPLYKVAKATQNEVKELKEKLEQIEKKLEEIK